MMVVRNRDRIKLYEHKRPLDQSHELGVDEARELAEDIIELVEAGEARGGDR